MIWEYPVTQILKRVCVFSEDQDLLVRVLREDAINELSKQSGLRVRLEVLGQLPELFHCVSHL